MSFWSCLSCASPTIGVKGKIAPRYVGPFRIVEKCGPIAYQLWFSKKSELSKVHIVFHVFQLKKYLKQPIEIVIEDVDELQEDFSYSEHHIRIIDQKARVTRHKTLPFNKVQYSNHPEEESMWEIKKFLRSKFLEFLA
jgi:hypothetical protein